MPGQGVDVADTQVSDGSGEDASVGLDMGREDDGVGGDPDGLDDDPDPGDGGVTSDTGAPDVTAPDAPDPDTIPLEVIEPDATSLAVELMSPVDGAHVRGVVAVTAGTSGEDTVVQVTFFVDDSLFAEVRTAPYAFDWNTDELAEGVHTIDAVAIGASDRSAMARIAVTVDRTPPDVTVDAPVGGTYENLVELAATVTDNGSVDRVEWYLVDEDFRLEIDGETSEVTYLEGNLVSTVDASPFESVLDGSDLPAGEWAVAAVAYDDVGLAASDSGSFWRGRPPTVEFVSPVDGATVYGPGTVRAAVRTAATRAVVMLHVDGTEVESRSVGGYAPGIDTEIALSWEPVYERADRLLRVDVVDSSGRTASDMISVLVDHPLVLAVELCDPVCAPPAGGDVVSDAVVVDATTRDDDGATTRVEFFLDDVLESVATTAPWTWEWDTAGTLDGSRMLRVVATSSNGTRAERSYTVRVNNCDRDNDGHRSLACGGPDCDDADRRFVSHACGSCTPLGGLEGDPCGVCGSGEERCSAGELVCVGDLGEAARNVCGGCAAMTDVLGAACDGCGGGGALECAPDGDSLICVSHVTNACGGCARLSAEPGTSCGPCGLDAWECVADGEAVVCGGATHNACGGCAALAGVPGRSCDTCGAAECRWECVADDGLACVAVPALVDGFVLVPAGSFVMGSPPDELGGHVSEAQHTVTLTRSFYIQAREVTQAEWESVMGTTPSRFSSCGPACPVERVNWWDALAFANALSRREGLPECYALTGCSDVGGGCPSGAWSGLGCYEDTCGSAAVTAPRSDPYGCTGYRLPTEAEWEYAARAGTATATHSGDLTDTRCADPMLSRIAWYCGNAAGTPHPVGNRAANSWGLYDTAGNIMEWVWDWLGPYPGDVSDPLGPTSGTYRIVRGGTWSGIARLARAGARDAFLPSYRGYNAGFRLARTAP